MLEAAPEPWNTTIFNFVGTVAVGPKVAPEQNLTAFMTLEEMGRLAAELNPEVSPANLADAMEGFRNGLLERILGFTGDDDTETLDEIAANAARTHFGLDPEVNLE